MSQKNPKELVKAAVATVSAKENLMKKTEELIDRTIAAVSAMENLMKKVEQLIERIIPSSSSSSLSSSSSSDGGQQASLKKSPSKKRSGHCTGHHQCPDRGQQVAEHVSSPVHHVHDAFSPASHTRGDFLPRSPVVSPNKAESPPKKVDSPPKKDEGFGKKA